MKRLNDSSITKSTRSDVGPARKPWEVPQTKGKVWVSPPQKQIPFEPEKVLPKYEGQITVRPKKFWRLHNRGGRMGGKRPDPRNQATRLQQVQVTVSRGMAQGSIPGETSSRVTKHRWTTTG